MKLSSDNPVIQTFVHNHVVSINYEGVAAGTVSIGTGSGFPVEIAGEWWLVTAGHVLGEINEARGWECWQKFFWATRGPATTD